MITVREFSVAGPCIKLGELIKETDAFWIYRSDDGRARRVRKRTDTHYSPAHIVACHSCMDHPRTSYPHGYMD